MKLKTLCAALAAALVAGCSTTTRVVTVPTGVYQYNQAPPQQAVSREVVYVPLAYHPTITRMRYFWTGSPYPRNYGYGDYPSYAPSYSYSFGLGMGFGGGYGHRSYGRSYGGRGYCPPTVRHHHGGGHGGHDGKHR